MYNENETVTKQNYEEIYYILPIVLLVMNVLSGCTDSEEEQGPVVVEVDDEEMLRQGWKWAVALDNDLRMQCSPDIVNGGYVMQMTDMDSYDAVFVLTTNAVSEKRASTQCGIISLFVTTL